MVLGKGSKFNDIILHRDDHSLVSEFSIMLECKAMREQDCCDWIAITMLSIVVPLVLIIGIPLNSIAFMFDVLHALVYYVLVHPERIFEPIAKTSVSPNRAKDIVNAICAKRRLFYAFSERIPPALSACVRLTALYPFWLLAWFRKMTVVSVWKCLKYIKMTVVNVWKLLSLAFSFQHKKKGFTLT